MDPCKLQVIRQTLPLIFPPLERSGNQTKCVPHPYRLAMLVYICIFVTRVWLWVVSTYILAIVLNIYQLILFPVQ